jgi:2-haloacid dehalogenase
MPIRAVIFDFGNVLIRWDPHNLYNKYFDNHTIAIDRFLEEINFNKWNLAQDKGYPFKQAVKELTARFPQYEHLIRAYHEEWEESINGLIPETVAILHKLYSAGYKLYGLTNWSAEKFYSIRPKFVFFKVFEDILVSGDVKLLKPDPAIFNLLLKRNNLKPEECILIDDSLQNIETAQIMGFTACHFTYPEQLERELQQMNIL